MKSKFLRAGMGVVTTGALVLAAGCVVYPSGRVAFAPIVVAPAPVYVAPPPPVVETEPAMVPDGYVWDGYEYIGIVGDQYYYLGPGDVWLVAEPWRLDRFHGWERGHADWRGHLVHNDRYRRDAHGRERPMRDEHH
jgi:hypothetical protein